MEKRAEGRLIPEGALRCEVEWDHGREEGKIHNISTQGALLEARSDFGISRIKLTLYFELVRESITVDAAIRWHAVSPQDHTDHYGLVFRRLDEETQQRLDMAIRALIPDRVED
jgi:hypothetical protein